MPGKILILNGPNLNLLGSREPEIYGSETLSDIEKKVLAEAKTLGFTADFKQSNSESELVEWIQGSKDCSAIIINAAAYTHTSVAIFDALSAIKKPIVEVHLSNIFSREEFRHHSYISKIAKGVICGFGSVGYILALKALKEILK